MKKIVLIGILVLVVLTSRKGSENQVTEVEPILVEQKIELHAHTPVDDLTVNNAPVTNDGVARATKPEVDNDQVSGVVLILTGTDATYKERLAAMRQLGYEIQPQDVEVLMEFLSAQMPTDSKLRAISFNSIRNDALELLLRQKELPEGMGELLTNVYNDSNHDDMWRNYCIQFMEPYYKRQAKDSEDAIPPDQELQFIQDSLWDALGERDNSNAGTALLALDKLSRNHLEFDKEDIQTAMVDLATDDRASLANRVTALRLCGERGNVQALETARDLARNGGTTMIRCAAIATLGDLGTEEDLLLLESYAASRDKRIAQIANAALDKKR